jgi:pseudouridine-5'-phosphate glycosidase/pseudouridine kinase
VLSPLVISLPWVLSRNTADLECSEPTSVVKSTAILPAIASCLELSDTRSPITYATPNLLELARLYNAFRAEPLNLTSHDVWWRVIDNFAISHRFRMELEQLAKRNVSDDDVSKGSLSFLVDDGIGQMAVNLLPFFQNIVIKCGERGLIVAMRVSGLDAATSQWAQEDSNLFRRRIVVHGKTSREIVVLLHIPALPLPQDSIVNVTGAGDTLVGSMLASLLLQKKSIFSHPSLLDDAMHAGQRAAVLTLKSSHAVSPLLASMARD